MKGDVAMGDLTAEHLAAEPLWVVTSAECGPNDGMLRPTTKEKWQKTGGLMVCAATFVLADGSEHPGFFKPLGSPAPVPQLTIALLAPTLCTPRGQIHFWTPEGEPIDRSAAYALLDGRAPYEVFPALLRAGPSAFQNRHDTWMIVGFHTLVRADYSLRVIS
jgi:hypothetical protein